MKFFKISIMTLFVNLAIMYVYAGNNNEFINQFFAELDINNDSIIDKKDIKKFSKKEFNMMDKDEDKTVSKNEFFEFICNKNCQKEKCDCLNIDKINDAEYIIELWSKVDKNMNDIINYQEKLEYDLENFYIMDINNDDKITREEVEAELY